MKKIFLFCLLMMTACAHRSPPSVKSQKVVAKKSPTSKQSLKNSEQREKSELKRDQAMVLQAKKSRFEMAAKVYPQKKSAPVLSKPAAPGELDQDKLFSEIYEKYEMNDEIGFRSRQQAFVQNFPKSPRVWEVYYMAGLLSFSNKDYGRSLAMMDMILKQAPKSAQAPKALFAKAITYKRMNLVEPSRRLLTQVKKQYPKSLEAQRAELELKIQEKKFQ